MTRYELIKKHAEELIKNFNDGYIDNEAFHCDEDDVKNLFINSISENRLSIGQVYELSHLLDKISGFEYDKWYT